MLFRLTIASFLLVLGQKAFAQKIDSVRAHRMGRKIVVSYFLSSNNPDSRFKTSIYSSIDGFTKALDHVVGDVGEGIVPGSHKKIIVGIDKAMSHFKGRISFQIRAIEFNPMVQISNPRRNQIFRRGRSYLLSWIPSTSMDKIGIELWDNRKRMGGETDVLNTGEYIWKVPTSLGCGPEYRLRFINLSDTTQNVYSPNFRIGRRIPLALKICAGAVIAVGGVLLWITEKKEDKPFPKPPGVPLNSN
jgi:hypothetical protein